ncbi:MAG: hypothetical protein ACLQF0_17085 [Dissulfurispiraceae bacterium]
MLEKVKNLFSGKEDKTKITAAEQINIFDIQYAVSEKESELKKTYNLKYWKPRREGDELHGEVIEKGKAASNYGDQEYIKIKQGEHVYMVYVTSVLARQLLEENCQLHDKIMIKFLGDCMSQDGKRQYKNYLVLNIKNIEKKVDGDGIVESRYKKTTRLLL